MAPGSSKVPSLMRRRSPSGERVANGCDYWPRFGGAFLPVAPRIASAISTDDKGLLGMAAENIKHVAHISTNVRTGCEHCAEVIGGDSDFAESVNHYIGAHGY